MRGSFSLVHHHKKLSRWVAAVLVMAMAFSIVAVPASAASAESNTWAAGNEWEFLEKDSSGNYQSVTGIMWGNTEQIVREWIIEEHPDYTEEQIETELKEKQAEFQEDTKENVLEIKFTYYEGDIPLEAAAGVSRTEDSTIYWYTEDDWSLLEHSPVDMVVDWNTGIITTSYVTAYPIGYKAPETSSTGTSPSKDDSGAGVVLLAGGAAAAAAGAYLYYAHPEIIGNAVASVKNFFGDFAAKAQSVFQPKAETALAAN